MTGVLHQLSQQRLIGENGGVVGANIFFYLTLTTDFAPIYSDPDLSRPLANPVEVAAGKVLPDIYLDPDIIYRRRIEYTDGTVTDLDPINSSVAATGISFIQKGVNAVSRSLQSKLEDVVSVKDFGAKGDGSSNDTAAITAADVQAGILGKALFFPAGTYLTAPIAATASWSGEPGGTVIKGRGSPSGFNALVTWDNVDNLVVYGITFDGNVSADPGSWNSLNYDSFTGYAGATANFSTNPQFVNCRAQNCNWSGFRFVECTAPRWSGCSTDRCRGNFGDGFIAISCVGTMAENCFANDFTRGGFIVDSFGTVGTVITNQVVAFSNCWATGGHDASINYGGLEYNFGLWAENAGDVAISNCFSFNNPDRGIVAVTGFKSIGFVGDRAMVTISNCQSVNAIAGILVQSIGDLPMEAKIVGCTAKGATFGFSGIAENASDNFTFIGCHAEYNAASNVGQGFAFTATAGLSAQPGFVVGPGCTVARTATNSTFLNTTDPNVAVTADVGVANNNGSAVSLTIDGLRHITALPVYARWHGSVAHSVTIRDTDIVVPFGAMSAGQVDINNCTTRWVNIGSASRVTFSKGVLKGGANSTVTATLIEYDCDTDISDNSRVGLATSSGTNFPAITIKGTLHQKNIPSNGPIFVIGDAGGSRTYFQGCRWFNKGSSTLTVPWALYAAGGSGGNFTCIDVTADNTVDSLFDVAGGSGGPISFTGVTKVAMR